jgi:2-polyprenyl-6-hydroxyphenyl methylase/3-demethylubiquinone-9 3-methyltransferase
MSRFPLLRFRLPQILKDTRHLGEGPRYDLLSQAIPDFILSENNPLIWQNELRYPYFRCWMGDLRGKRVLDIGCGWGFLARKFAAGGAKLTCLDLSSVTMKMARSEASKQLLTMDYIRSAAEHQPLACSFDIVTAADVLEHVENLPAVIAEISRVLKPGGLFGFVTANRNWLARFIYITMGETLMGLLPRGTHRYPKFIKPRELQDLLSAHGLQLLDLRGILVNPVLRKYHFWPSRAVEYIGVAKKG